MDNYWNNHCFLCRKPLGRDDISYFTFEFDGYICGDCFEDMKNGNIEGPEEEIIANEFFGKSKE